MMNKRIEQCAVLGRRQPQPATARVRQISGAPQGACAGEMTLLFQMGLLATLVAVTAGCHSMELTTPERSALEQLLLSTAVDHSLSGVNLEPLRDKRVYLEERYFESYDKGYVLGTIRQVLSSAGALLVDEAADAETIVEARSGGLGIDKRETLFGIPEMGVPVPLSGSFEIPEIALYKSTKADAIGKIALFAYDQETREFVHSAGPFAGRAKFHHYKFLGLINWRVTDIPEVDPKVERYFGREGETGSAE